MYTIPTSLNQAEIDTAYNLAKNNTDQVFDKSLPFICHMIHLRAFDVQFIRYFKAKEIQDKETFPQPIWFKNERVCWCPCNNHFKTWRNKCCFEKYVDQPCENKACSMQELINHLQGHKLEDCKAHCLLYIFIYYLHKGKKDRHLVSQIRTKTFANIVN